MNIYGLNIKNTTIFNESRVKLTFKTLYKIYTKYNGVDIDIVDKLFIFYMSI